MSNILNFSKLAKVLSKIQPKENQSFTTIFVDTTSYCDEEIEHGILQYSKGEIQESYVLALEQSIIDYCVANQFKLSDGDLITIKSTTHIIHLMKKDLVSHLIYVYLIFHLNLKMLKI
jgi:hypothetical protein